MVQRCQNTRLVAFHSPHRPKGQLVPQPRLEHNSHLGFFLQTVATSKATNTTTTASSSVEEATIQFTHAHENKQLNQQPIEPKMKKGTLCVATSEVQICSGKTRSLRWEATLTSSSIPVLYRVTQRTYDVQHNTLLHYYCGCVC